MSLRASLILLITLCSSPLVFSTESTADRRSPVLIAWSKGINSRDVQLYLYQLVQELELDGPIADGLKSAQPAEMFARDPQTVNGTAVLLSNSFPPSPETMTFQTVADEAEARHIVEATQRHWGSENTTLHDDGNSVYRVTHGSHYDRELSPEEDFQPTSTENGNFRHTTEIVEVDGKQMVRTSWQSTRMFRYQDGLLYSGYTESFLTMQLPTGQEIRDRLNHDLDAGISLDPDSVPKNLRQMGWNMLNAMVSTQLQTRDADSEALSAVRSSAGTLGLAWLRALMLDVQSGIGEGHLARDGKPIRGSIQLEPRRNSRLIRMLDELGSGRSRFAPLTRQDAAVSLHACIALSQEAQDLLQSLSNWIQTEQHRVSMLPEAQQARRILADSLRQIAEDGTLECVLRLMHSDSSGSVLLAGAQLAELNGGLETLEPLLRIPDLQLADGKMNQVRRQGQPFLHLSVPANSRNIVQLTDVWLTHQDGCLWIAAGGEQAWQAILQAQEQCRSGGRPIRTRLLTCKIDLKHWSDWPDKDPTGLSQLPDWLDQEDPLFHQLASTPFTGEGLETPQPLLSRILAGNSRQAAWVTLDADRAGLQLELNLDRTFADWILARFMDLRQRMMRRMQQESEAKMKAAEADE